MPSLCEKNSVAKDRGAKWASDQALATGYCNVDGSCYPTLLSYAMEACLKANLTRHTTPPRNGLNGQ